MDILTTSGGMSNLRKYASGSGVGGQKFWEREKQTRIVFDSDIHPKAQPNPSQIEGPISRIRIALQDYQILPNGNPFQRGKTIGATQLLPPILSL